MRNSDPKELDHFKVKIGKLLSKIRRLGPPKTRARADALDSTRKARHKIQKLTKFQLKLQVLTTPTLWCRNNCMIETRLFRLIRAKPSYKCKPLCHRFYHKQRTISCERSNYGTQLLVVVSRGSQTI